MSLLVRQSLASKIASRIGSDQRIAKQIEYLIRVNGVDKNLKDPGLVTVYLNRLDNKINPNLLKDFKDDLVEKSEVTRDGKLKIQVNPEYFKQTIFNDIAAKKSNYGFEIGADELYPRTLSKKETVWWPKMKSNSNTIIEFSSPNIAKPLHAGHMRSTFLGNFLSNLHASLGRNTTRINYLGDWGTQYGILAVGFKKYGSTELLKESPIKHLLEVYVKANQDESLKEDALKYFSLMEQKDEESLKMWSLFKDLSIEELKIVYKNLNIEFDSYEFESQYYEQAKEWVKRMCEHGIAKRSEDNTIKAELEITNSDTKKKEMLKYIVQKSDNSTLYITRDIAAVFERKKKYKFDKIVYVVDMSQRDHFVKLFHTVNSLDSSVLNELTFNEFYVPFGRMTNMSTRKGQIEFLSDLITEAKQVAFDSMEFSKNKRDVADPDFVAQTIGVSHLIISDFYKPRIKDYEFSWANIVSKDNTAYMCHYAHARLNSLITKCKDKVEVGDRVNLSLLTSPTEIGLIQHLAKFDEAVWKAYEEYEPSQIVHYLFQLVRLLNVCLRDNYVLNEEIELAKSRLFLYKCTKQVIANSFTILGITPLDQI